jgi:hypothetical protein
MPITKEDLIKELRALRELTGTELERGFNCLLLGNVGSGKSPMIGLTLSSTPEKPIVVDSFDPDGWNNPLFKEAKDSGRLIVDTRWERSKETGTAVDPTKIPSMYKSFEQEFLRRRSVGFFDSIGTYVIDSFTNYSDSMVAYIGQKNSRPEGKLEIQDWQIISNMIRDTIKMCCSYKCNFILTAHTVAEKDEGTGKLLARLHTQPSLQVRVPSLFSEIYILQAKESSKGIVREVLTQQNGLFNEVRTRLGAGKFDLREPANFDNLLKKAGWRQ